MYTRNRFDRELLVKLQVELAFARSALEQERPHSTLNDDCDEQLREVIGELQGTITDLEIERNCTARMGVDLEAPHQEKEHSASAGAEVEATRQEVHSEEDRLRLTTAERDRTTPPGPRGITRTGVSAPPSPQIRKELDAVRNDVLQHHATEGAGSSA